MPHVVEIWETTGPEGTLHRATCLACGRYGEGRELWSVAVAEGEAHEAAETARLVIAGRQGGDPRRPSDRRRRPRAR
jgi:hypothetical protein